ncbi:MAG TPA: phosphate acetyltransferase [Candidatus Woesearchaeota archaeon]|nr:phosphate acetyltransferase [Candidatus Woesearchaeota archaeon]
MGLIDEIVNMAKDRQKRIAFPEFEDERVVKAIEIIIAEKIAIPVLVGDRQNILSSLREKDIENLEIYDPSEGLSEEYLEFIKDRFKLNDQTVIDYAKGAVPYSFYLLKKGIVDGAISGAIHATKDTILNAIKIVGVKEDVKRISSFFIMNKGKKNYLFADCAINIDPNPIELCEIARLTCSSAKNLGMLPRIAFLSFSTYGSARHELVDKIKEATSLAKEAIKECIVDGEMQLDAAIVPKVARLKCPKSKIKGKANVLIFPSLESGNIGYKIAERFGKYEAIGPIIQGLRRPVNDLSRGCSSEDIVKLCAITAIQSEWKD